MELTKRGVEAHVTLKRYGAGLAVLAGLALSVVACGDNATIDDVGLPPAAASAAERAEINAMCNAVRDLHSDLIDRANTMSSLEVDASPEERAAILNHGLSDLISIAELAELPDRPASMTAGMEQRRAEAIVELRVEEETLLNTWDAIDQVDRAGAVNRVFLLTEKLMSETEPKVSSETPQALIDAARDTDSCEFVIQLPPAE